MPPQMGNLPLPVQRPWLMYAEWAVFAALIAALIGLWWFLEFRPSKQQAGDTSYRVPQEVVNNLLLGTSTSAVQSIPKVVVKNLETPVASAQSPQKQKGASQNDAPPMPPQQVLQFLSSTQ